MTIAAADLEQAKAGAVAADLIEQIVQLPLDSLLQRLVGRQIFAIRKIPDPDRFGGVDERVTEFHKLRRRDTRLGLGKLAIDYVLESLHSRTQHACCSRQPT